MTTTCLVTTRLGVPLGEVADATVEEMVWELNAPGSARVSVPTLSKSSALLQVMETELQIWVDDVLRWWGYPVGISGDDQRLTFELDGLLSYFGGRNVTNASLLFTTVDQLSIAASIVSQMQTGADRNLHILTASFSPSGVPRSRNYDRTQHQSSLDMLLEFPTLVNGFDMGIEVFGDGSRWWTPYYPNKGSIKYNSTLEWGKNISKFTYKEDGTKLANLVYETGATDAGIKYENYYRDDVAAARFGEFHAIISAGNEKDVDWLLAKAQQDVKQRAYPIKTPELTSVSVPSSMLGQLVEGDTVPIFIDHGRVQIPLVQYRVLSVKWNPDTTLTYTVKPLVGA